MEKLEMYSTIIKNLIEQRKQANPSYSMRAFARDVDIEQSNLCKILSGKRRLNHNQAYKISKACSLSPEQAMLLMNSVPEFESLN